MRKNPNIKFKSRKFIALICRPFTIAQYVPQVIIILLSCRERQDLLLGLAKTVANNTAALVLKAKNVASKCEDQYTQNRV
jgi:hypothetical protein